MVDIMCGRVVTTFTILGFVRLFSIKFFDVGKVFCSHSQRGERRILLHVDVDTDRTMEVGFKVKSEDSSNGK